MDLFSIVPTDSKNNHRTCLKINVRVTAKGTWIFFDMGSKQLAFPFPLCNRMSLTKKCRSICFVDFGVAQHSTLCSSEYLSRAVARRGGGGPN